MDTKWIRAFYNHPHENSEQTAKIIDEVLTWRNEFNSNGFLFLFTVEIAFLFGDGDRLKPIHFNTHSFF